MLVVAAVTIFGSNNALSPYSFPALSFKRINGTNGYGKHRSLAIGDLRAME